MISSDSFPLVNDTWSSLHSFDQNHVVTTQEQNHDRTTSDPRSEGLEIHKLIMMILLPPIVIIGSFGNAMAIAVLLRPRMRYTSVYFYLLVLACADTVVLYLTAAKTWLRVATGWELIHMSSPVCKVVMYIMLVAQWLSAWLVVLMTVDRFLAVWFPFKAASLTSLSRARFVTLFLTLVVLFINCHVFWSFGLQFIVPPNAPGFWTCNYYPEFRAMNGAFEYFKLLAYSCLPFVIILSLNIAIIVRLHGRTAATSSSPEERRSLAGRPCEVPSLNDDVARLSARYNSSNDNKRCYHGNASNSQNASRQNRKLSSGQNEMSSNKSNYGFLKRDGRYLGVDNGVTAGRKFEASKMENSGTFGDGNEGNMCKVLLQHKYRQRAASAADVSYVYGGESARNKVDEAPRRTSALSGCRYSITAHRADDSRGKVCFRYGDSEMESSLSTPSIGGGMTGNGGVFVGTSAAASENWQTRLTFMLLVVSFSWLVLTGPWTVYGIFQNRIKNLNYDYPIMVYVRMVVFLLMYTNHAVNFYLYCITGRKFRSELLGLLGCSKSGQIGNTGCCSRSSRHRKDKPRQLLNRSGARDRGRVGLVHQPSASPSSTASMRGLPGRSTNIIELDMIEY